MSDSTVPPFVYHAPTESEWRVFWNRGRWWKAVLITLGYLLLYRLAGWVAAFGLLLFDTDTTGSAGSPDGPLGSPAVLLLTLVFPLVIGSLLLLGFAASVGWTRQLFGRQPVAGRWWMWLAVALAATPMVLRLVGIDYGLYSPAVVCVVFLGGLLVGFSEELL